MPVSCPDCGHESPTGVRFCTSCGASLARAAFPRKEPTPPEPVEPLAAPPPDAESRTWRAVGRTRDGFFFLAVAFVLLILPFVSLIGLLLAIVAVVWIYLGAEAFGGRHRRYVVRSIAAHLAIGLALVVTAFAFAFPLVRAQDAGADPETVRDLVVRMAVVLAVWTALLGIPHLLIAYRLLGKRERRLGWGILGVHVALSAAFALTTVLSPERFHDLVLRGGTLGGVATDPFSILFSLGNLLWAYLYYQVSVRVADGLAEPSDPFGAS